MTHNPSNPIDNAIEPWQLTAYALNELDPDDANRIEQALESNSTLRVELEQIQKTLTAVRSALAETPASVKLSKNQTAAVASQIEQVAAPVEMPSTNKVRLADRPFYRRKRFAALLATAAAIPLAATWLPSFFEVGGPLAVQVNDQTLPNAYYLNDDVGYVGEANGLAAANSKTIELSAKASDESVVSEIVVPDASNYLELYNSIESADAKARPGNDGKDIASITGSQEAGASAPSPVKASEESYAIDTGPIRYPSAEVWRELASRKLQRYGDVEVKDVSDGSEKLSSSTQSIANVPAGGSILLGGIKRTREVLEQDGEKQEIIVSGRKDGNSVPAETKSLMMTQTPRIIIPEEEVELKLGRVDSLLRTESLAVHDKRVRDTQLNPAEQLPAELRQNAPHLFKTPAIERTSTDRFEKIVETPFLETQKAPLSTFSIDVDTASYSKIRQTLMEGNRLPTPSMVRIEEMVNYFEYEYAGPQDDRPFSAHMIIDRCPWNAEHQLVRVGLQAKKLDKQNRVKANIVFLLDVSGSMDEPNKLPLVKKALSMLVNQLTENDRVAIVVYAGAAGCVLPSTSGIEKQKILSSLDHLNAGGSTNGGQGIQLAYSIAKEQFIPGGANRVVLCTDGDFNVGVTGDDALVAMMQENAKSNIFLTCLGFGAGNYNDTMMEKISNKGNGVYGMIDNELEARRMMVDQLGGTLVTVAKDVKIQVDFNPAKIAGYRLIGYEDRRLANKDFDNDQKDAGEIGAGHRVTALYEVIPAGKSLSINPPSDSEASKYLQRTKTDSKFEAPVAGEYSSEVLTLKVRYKKPEGSVSTKQEFVLNETDGSEKPLIDRDMQWATSVAEFGLLLRHSQMAPQADWSDMLERAASSAGGDAYRLECLAMMRKARSMFP